MFGYLEIPENSKEVNVEFKKMKLNSKSVWSFKIPENSKEANVEFGKCFIVVHLRGLGSLNVLFCFLGIE